MALVTPVELVIGLFAPGLFVTAFALGVKAQERVNAVTDREGDGILYLCGVIGIGTAAGLLLWASTRVAGVTAFELALIGVVGLLGLVGIVGVLVVVYEAGRDVRAYAQHR